MGSLSIAKVCLLPEQDDTGGCMWQILVHQSGAREKVPQLTGLRERDRAQRAAATTASKRC